MQGRPARGRIVHRLDFVEAGIVAARALRPAVGHVLPAVDLVLAGGHLGAGVRLHGRAFVAGAFGFELRGATVARAGREIARHGFEEFVDVQLGLDHVQEVERRQLQELDRLDDLRREAQVQPLPEAETHVEAHQASFRLRDASPESPTDFAADRRAKASASTSVPAYSIEPPVPSPRERRVTGTPSGRSRRSK